MLRPSIEASLLPSWRMMRWNLARAFPYSAALLGVMLSGAIAPAADLAEIRDAGVLRLLVENSDDDALLPRRGWSPAADRVLAERFAAELGVSVDWIWVDDEGELIPALLEGRGDMIADGLEITDERKRHIGFSTPFLYVREQVITSADDTELRWRRQLSTRRMAANEGLGHWGAAQRLKRAYPKMEIEEVEDPTGVDELLEGVAEERFDVTLAQRQLVQEYLAAGEDLRVAFDVGEETPVGWALPPGAPELQKAVDGFLQRVGTWADGDEPFTGDLAEIRERGVLRVLTRNSAASYYVWRGRLAGFEYEMARRLAKRLGVHLEIVVPPSRAELVPWLLEGRGDLIAAGLPAARGPAQELGAVFSAPTHEATAQFVGRAADADLDTVEELAGRKVVARGSGAAWPALEELQATGIDFELESAPDFLEDEDLVDGVAKGEYDLVFLGSNSASTQLAWRKDVRVLFSRGEPLPLAWALRPGNPELLAAVDAYLTDPKLASDRATIRRRYFENRERMRSQGKARVAGDGKISPYDELVRRWANHYGYDWRLISAQMFQESGFDPKATSWVGAFGLMQLMPATADQMNVTGWKEPAGNVQAGVKYMGWVRDRFSGEVPERERRWMALAAYNAGIGHVTDARALARDEGLDPNRWFGHVEKAMLLKMDPEYHRRTRFGFCRGSEPVEYVNRIRELYRAYSQAVPMNPAGS